jgi:hypothetical protein
MTVNEAIQILDMVEEASLILTKLDASTLSTNITPKIRMVRELLVDVVGQTMGNFLRDHSPDPQRIQLEELPAYSVWRSAKSSF